MGITVHNGTDTAGLAARAGSTLEGAGFTAVTVSPGVYSEQTPTDSTVYYASEDKEAVAKAVAKELGTPMLNCLLSRPVPTPLWWFCAAKSAIYAS